MEKFIEMEKILMDENKDVITKFGFLNMDESNYITVLINFVSLIFQVFFFFSKFDVCVHQS
jgi:hypothetical protein